MKIELNYKNDEQIFHIEEGGVPYLEYPLLSKTGVVNHGFSTRLGGVSEGYFSSMNLSFTRGDQEEAVRENFRRFTSAIGVRCEDLVFSKQTHTTNVRVVREEDRGTGFTRELDYTD
ncbi:MAG: laccase domain-containing protein, partial [Ruminococcus sp.]|nr:laccase domain-containing protein [Ruminococcus sp.]